MTALGSTTDARALVPGNDASVRADAAALEERSGRLDDLADDLAAFRVPAWTGPSADTFHETLGRQPRTWRTTADALTSAAGRLTTYADVLVGAQADAARAIDLWAEGEAATASATRTHDAQVAGYLRSLTSTQPEPPPPPFVDPGAALRQEAQDLLDSAREAVRRAGDDAADALAEITVSDVPVVHNQAGWQGPTASGSTSGPLFTYDPATGEMKLDVAKAEGEASLFSADASSRATHGSLFAEAEASTMIGARGEALAGVTEHTLRARAEGSVGLHADASASAGHEHASVEVGASGLAGAHAEAGVQIGKEGVTAEAGAFAGAKGEVNAGIEVAGVGAEASAEGWAGIGAEADAGLGRNPDGSWTLRVKAGAAVGLGGSGEVALKLDPQGVVDAVEDAADWVGSLFD